jgi:hypothetical protein
LEHALALPNEYHPGWHVALTPAADAHAAPGGHASAAPSSSVLQIRPLGQAEGAELPAAQNVPTGHTAAAVSPVALQNRPLRHSSGLDMAGSGQLEPIGHV